MAINFPTSLDTLFKPTAGQSTNNPAVAHSQHHRDMATAIEKIQQRIGITNTTDVNSLEFTRAQCSSIRKIGSRVGIGISPAAAHPNADNCVVGADSESSAGLSIYSQDGGTAYLMFARPSDNTASWIQHVHSTEAMEFVVQGTTRLRLQNGQAPEIYIAGLGIRSIVVGGADSGGTGYRTLRVAN